MINVINCAGRIMFILQKIADNWMKEHGIKQNISKVDDTVYENIGRNDPCPCQSGKKYKKCCGRNS